MQIEKLFAVGVLGMMGLAGACTVEIGDSNSGTAGSGGGGNAGSTAGSAGTAGNAGRGGTAGGASGSAGTSGDASVDVAVDVRPDGALLDALTIDAGTSTDAKAEPSLPDALVPSDRVGSTDTTGAGDRALDTGDGRDAGGSCLEEDVPDSGAPMGCDSLSYYFDSCSNDAGDTQAPAGAALCDTLRPSLKRSAFEQLFGCLQALEPSKSGTPSCSAAHEQAAAQCSQSLFTNGNCPVPDSTVDGGIYGCNEIAASCRPDSGNGSIEIAECWAWLGPFNTTTRQEIIDCYLDPSVTGAAGCRDKFENFCAFPE